MWKEIKKLLELLKRDCKHVDWYIKKPFYRLVSSVTKLRFEQKLNADVVLCIKNQFIPKNSYLNL